MVYEYFSISALHKKKAVYRCIVTFFFAVVRFGVAWQGESPVGEEVACGMDIMFDSVGSDGGAANGFTLDE